jgi:50S ribosomal protein L16 3-hydroxylase
VAVLQSWLGEVPLASFREMHLGAAPLAGSSTANATIAACDWRVLDGLLASQPDDVLVVAHGQPLEMPAPRSLAELRRLFAVGIGIAVRRPERYCRPLAELARAFARELPGEQRVIVFATPQRTHGFGWHYDAEDVFIAQTAGEKTYYFRQNSIDRAPVRGAQPDFRSFRLETTSTMQCRLVAGDFLYLPRGYWHVAHAQQDSLSISIGVFPDR